MLGPHPVLYESSVGYFAQCCRCVRTTQPATNTHVRIYEVLGVACDRRFDLNYRSRLLTRLSHSASCEPSSITYRMSLPSAHPGQLPADVLCEILSLLAIIDPPGPVGYRHPAIVRYTLGWVKITHVCHRWRAIGLDFASLWAKTICALPNSNGFIKTSISRARQAHVVITLERDLQEPKRVVFRDFVAQNPKRIREITDVVANPRRWYACMKNKTFPNLLVLSITAHGAYTNDTPGSFSIEAPNLRSLTLSEPSFAIVAPKLRSLSLRCKKNRTECSLKIILRCLQCAPAVDHLEVWVPLHIQSAAGATDSVSLPHVKHVEISGSLAGCTAFCEKVIFPSDVHIIVDAKVPSSDPFTTAPLLRALNAQLTHNSHDAITLDTSGGGRSGTEHPCMKIALDSSNLAERGGRWPRVALEIGIYKKGLNDLHKRDLILAEFLANVSTLEVKKLSVAHALQWSDFERAFKEHVFTSVHTVSVDFLATALLYEANVGSSARFPALRNLIVSKHRSVVQRGQWRNAWYYLNKVLALATDPKLSVRMVPSDDFKYGTIGYPLTDAEGVATACRLASEFIDERLTAEYHSMWKNKEFKVFEK
ncbi:hypothetical protein PENSPDRAFT_698767 [Peniophora sp. CONT]|nr:hypothetical protein PENSPDRAFT_698767 [Peniophora sp. CONT]